MENPLLKAYHFTFEMRRVWSDQPEQGIPIIKVWDARRRDFILKREDPFQMGASFTNRTSVFRTFESSTFTAQAASACKRLYPSDFCIADVVGVAPA